MATALSSTVLGQQRPSKPRRSLNGRLLRRLLLLFVCVRSTKPAGRAADALNVLVPGSTLRAGEIRHFILQIKRAAGAPDAQAYQALP